MDNKAPVTQRAVIQRINRKLKPDYRQVKTARGPRAEQSLGRYYMIDSYRNAIVDTDIDLDQVARDLQVLGAWERVSE
jgi:hypothetical protein